MKHIIDGKVLREAIRLKGYTMAEFAKAIKINRRTLYFYVEGERTPSLRRLVVISKLLNVEINEILVSGKAES
ncbi:MAG: helix-turn-helix domain-containing protein [Candidatus Omnitrophica bacterium]|nr:helix-turn-helix domain-containing protein [Candidatus Omnitrophota bacterium]